MKSVLSAAKALLKPLSAASVPSKYTFGTEVVCVWHRSSMCSAPKQHMLGTEAVCVRCRSSACSVSNQHWFGTEVAHAWYRSNTGSAPKQCNFGTKPRHNLGMPRRPSVYLGTMSADIDVSLVTRYYSSLCINYCNVNSEIYHLIFFNSIFS